MRKLTGILVVCLLVFTATSAEAQKLGIGGFLGMNIPVAQADAGSGTVFGFRGQLQAIPLIRIEPFVSFAKNGEYDIPGAYGATALDGGDLKAFGVNALLGSPLTAPGVGISLVAGIGSWKYDVDNYPSETRAGYTAGLDLALGLPTAPIGIHGRAELLVIPQDGGGSRKHALITVGAIYKFGR